MPVIQRCLMFGSVAMFLGYFGGKADVAFMYVTVSVLFNSFPCHVQLLRTYRVLHLHEIYSRILISCFTGSLTLLLAGWLVLILLHSLGFFLHCLSVGSITRCMYLVAENMVTYFSVVSMVETRLKMLCFQGWLA